MIYSSIVNFHFSVPARIEKGPKNQTVKPGSKITLEAKMSGDPEPDVSILLIFLLDGADETRENGGVWEIHERLKPRFR